MFLLMSSLNRLLIISLFPFGLILLAICCVLSFALSLFPTPLSFCCLSLSVCSSILQQNWMEILAEVKTKTETGTTTKYCIRLERISACGSNSFIKFLYFYLSLSSLPLNPRRKVEQTNWSEILFLFPNFPQMFATAARAQLQIFIYKYIYANINTEYKLHVSTVIYIHSNNLWPHCCGASVLRFIFLLVKYANKMKLFIFTLIRIF